MMYGHYGQMLKGKVQQEFFFQNLVKSEERMLAKLQFS
jgi:hypothetical protein